MSGEGRSASLARILLLLAGLLTLGRLASRAWFEGPDLDTPAPSSYAGSPSFAPRAGARPPAFLLAIVDGLREDATLASADPVMPFWRSLAGEGASGVAVTGEPTLTAACVRTLLTGRNPDLAAAARNFDAPVVRENLVQRVAEAGLRVGHSGDAAAWQFAKPWYAAPDVFQVPDQGPADQGGTDDRALPFALGRIAAGVDAMTVHFTRPDHAGHAHGADLEGAGGTLSPYAAACRTTDGYLRQVVDAFRARHPGALVVIAADHGLTSRGTHGGGETGARRAPFVAAGPLVVHREAVEISQASLASTMAALLRVAPLPFSEGAPALELTKLLPVERRAALEAYVNARLAVAASTGARDLSEAIAARRAAVGFEGTEAALARLAAEATTIEEATASTHDPHRVGAALAFAALLWLAAADPRPFRGRRETHASLAAAVAAVVLGAAVPQTLVAAFAVSGAFAVAASLRAGRPTGRAAAVALLAFPVLSGSVFSLVPVLESPARANAAALRLSLAAAALVGLSTWIFGARAARERLRGVVRSSPGGLLAVLGVAVGLPTSLRPFVDPFVDLSIPLAAITALLVALVCLSRGARAHAPRARFVFLGAVLAALFAPPAGAWGLTEAWAVALALSVAIGLAAALRRRSHATAAGEPDASRTNATVAATIATLGLAAASRLEWLPGPVPFLLAALAAVAALALSVRARGDGALVVRILAALSLAVLIERHHDDSTARFALLSLGAFAAGRLPGPSTSAGRVAFAAFLALLRIAAFHALGFSETLSTIDTGTGVVPGLDTGGEGTNTLTLGVILNVAIQALRFSLPWILLLAAAARSLERRQAPDAPRFVDVAGDLAGLLAVRGAALVIALSIWWPSSWWVPTAKAVFAFAAGDVVLVLGSAALCGVFARDRDGGGARVPALAV